MAATPPSQAGIDAFRDEADRFIAELDEEYYLHFAGLKERLELEPIYARHEDLTKLEQAQRLGAAVDGDRRIRELWKFSCEGHLGRLTREHSERVAELEAQLEAEIDGTKIGYRMLRPTIANEADRGKRRRLEQARNDLTDEHLNPIYLDAVQITQRTVGQLGAPTYVDLYKRFGYRLDNLADQCRSVLADTERMYEEAADRLFRARVGVGLDEAQRFDVPRVFRAQSWDAFFPADRMLPALEATLADLGIDLRSQENVHLDLEQRPSKTPRAFCAPIEVPEKVMLVIQPIGGADDWRALFREAGHTEHFAHTRADLSMEEKRLGDNAVTEGWAMLLQHLTDDTAWLARRLDVPRPDEFASEGATGLLYFVRRYCAKLLYELEFHSTENVQSMQPRYVELLADALKIEPSPTDYLADIDSGFYVTEYLRSWAFEAQLRAYLREKFGSAWFSKRDAGSLLRELWGEGQRHTADELLKEVTGTELEMAAVAERVAEDIR